MNEKRRMEKATRNLINIKHREHEVRKVLVIESFTHRQSNFQLIPRGGLPMTDHREPDWDPRSEPVLRNQLAAYDDLRQRCPVAYSEYHQWSLFRHADISRVLQEHQNFSSAVSAHLSVPNGMDPPEHTRY